MSGGIAAFFRACFQTTFHSGVPLMRANFTYSVSSTLSIAERVRRMKAATENQPSATPGRTTWEKPPRPDTGSQPRFTANIQMRTMPSQKGGNDCPSRATILPSMSMRVPFFTAETTPIGTAISTLKSRANPASWRLAGSASPMRPIAVCPWNLMESPKLSCRAFHTKRKYCS